MCDFFSCVTFGDRELIYFDWKQRQRIMKGRLKIASGQTVENADSHSEICAYYKADCDKANKYEYNPLIKEFKIDQINNKRDDSEVVEKKLKKLDFKTIVAPLIIKKIINPLEKKAHKIPLKKAVELVKKWASVRESVRESVWASVGASVGAYSSSFFKIKYSHDFSSAVKLWEDGYVPSYDGKIWRLHEYDGKILWEQKQEVSSLDA